MEMFSFVFVSSSAGIVQHGSQKRHWTILICRIQFRDIGTANNPDTVSVVWSIRCCHENIKNNLYAMLAYLDASEIFLRISFDLIFNKQLNQAERDVSKCFRNQVYRNCAAAQPKAVSNDIDLVYLVSWHKYC